MAECGTIFGAQRHMHNGEAVCADCLPCLDKLITDVLGTTQHGTEAGYHRHLRDTKRRKEWGIRYSSSERVLTDRVHTRARENAGLEIPKRQDGSPLYPDDEGKPRPHHEWTKTLYSGYQPQFLWGPVEDCPHIPSCAEAHAHHVKTGRQLYASSEEDMQRQSRLTGTPIEEIRERQQKLERKKVEKQVASGEKLDKLLRSPWRQVRKDLADLGVDLRKLLVTLPEHFNGLQPIDHAIQTGDNFKTQVWMKTVDPSRLSLKELKLNLPHTYDRIPTIGILLHRLMDMELVKYNGVTRRLESVDE